MPAEDAEYYLSKGYSPNDRVGTAYLEKQYEEVLQGQREKNKSTLIEMAMSKVLRQFKKGKEGNNIKLTIDLAFQDGVNAILKNTLKVSWLLVVHFTRKEFMQSHWNLQQVRCLPCRDTVMKKEQVA